MFRDRPFLKKLLEIISQLTPASAMDVTGVSDFTDFKCPYCTDICCFTRAYLFEYSSHHSTSKSFSTELHSSIDLCSLSLSRFCTSANLVTSPSFLSTARALLSIHCRESMCAFNTLPI